MLYIDSKSNIKIWEYQGQSVVRNAGDKIQIFYQCNWQELGYQMNELGFSPRILNKQTLEYRAGINT
jgi:hypothetical protein